MNLEIQDAGGVGSVTVAASFWTIEKLTLADVNDFVILATGCVGFIWMIYKAINARFEAKKAKREYERDIEESRK